MLTRDDLVELIVSRLREADVSGFAPAAAPKLEPKAATAARGRRFISEYDLRKMIQPGAARVCVPKDAIVSPLALDWLVLKGIAVDRE